MTQPVGHDDSIDSADVPDMPAIDDEAVKQAVRGCVGEQNFQHWFQKRARLSVTHDRLVVHVPNPFILNWLLKRFRTSLNRAAQLMLGPSGQCHLEIDGSLMDQQASVADITTATAAGAALPDVTDSTAAGWESEESAEAFDSSAFVPAGRSVRAAAVAAGDAPVQPNSAAHVPLAGRRRFRTFDTFVEGESNGMAVLASRQVAAMPGQRYNPLYMFGATGTGKTHLLEAIYSEIRRTRRNANVVHLSSEAFTNYFTMALSARTVPSFRQRFRNVDVLLVDNIEFLDNKRATQEEFLHTIVQVIENGGQVVVTSDRHPRMLTKHREELTTRFSSGLVCRIEPPDEMLCTKVAQSLASRLSATFAPDALQYVARKCKRSVREIQGALNSLEGYFALTRRRITLPVAREVLGDLAQECKRLVRINDVERVICEAFGVTAADLRSKSRRQAIACPRALAMFLSRRCTNSAYREIGMYFGGRDHSTVVAAEKRVDQWINSGDPMPLPTSCSGRTIAEVVEQLEARLMSLAL